MLFLFFVLQPDYQQTLGSRASNTKEQQCQAHSCSAGVHGQRQTMETAARSLSGGGWKASQTGEEGRVDLYHL